MQRKSQSNSSSSLSHVKSGQGKAVPQNTDNSKKLKKPLKHFPELRAWLLENPDARQKLPVNLEDFLRMKKYPKEANQYWKQVKSKFALKEDAEKIEYFLTMIRDGNAIRRAINEVWEQYPQIRKQVLSFPKDKFDELINRVLRSRIKKLMKSIMNSKRGIDYLKSLQDDFSKSIELLASALIGQSAETLRNIWKTLFKDQLPQLSESQYQKLKHVITQSGSTSISSVSDKFLIELDAACPGFSSPEKDSEMQIKSSQSKEKKGKKRKKDDSPEEKSALRAEEMEMKSDAELAPTPSPSFSSHSSSVTPSKKLSLVHSHCSLFASLKNAYKDTAPSQKMPAPEEQKIPAAEELNPEAQSFKALCKKGPIAPATSTAGETTSAEKFGYLMRLISRFGSVDGNPESIRRVKEEFIKVDVPSVAEPVRPLARFLVPPQSVVPTLLPKWEPASFGVDVEPMSPIEDQDNIDGFEPF